MPSRGNATLRLEVIPPGKQKGGIIVKLFPEVIALVNQTDLSIPVVEITQCIKPNTIN